MRTYTAWIKDEKELYPKKKKFAEFQAKSSVEALFLCLKKVHWDSVNVAHDIDIRDEQYYAESGNHAIVFSVHVGWDPMRDRPIGE